MACVTSGIDTMLSMMLFMALAAKQVFPVKNAAAIFRNANGNGFSLEHLTEQECHHLLRFSAREIDMVVTTMGFSPDDVFPNLRTRSECTYRECFAMLLRRLASCHRVSDVAMEFGRSTAAVSDCTLSLVQMLTNRYAYILYFDSEVQYVYRPLHPFSV
jgi:hypothetical protein